MPQGTTTASVAWVQGGVSRMNCRSLITRSGLSAFINIGVSAFHQDPRTVFVINAHAHKDKRQLRVMQFRRVPRLYPDLAAANRPARGKPTMGKPYRKGQPAINQPSRRLHQPVKHPIVAAGANGRPPVRPGQDRLAEYTALILIFSSPPVYRRSKSLSSARSKVLYWP